jgi:hypothetical protein
MVLSPPLHPPSSFLKLAGRASMIATNRIPEDSGFCDFNPAASPVPRIVSCTVRKKYSTIPMG